MNIYLAGGQVVTGYAMRLYLAGGQPQIKVAIQSTANQAESGGVMKAYLAESGGRLFGDANILQSFYYADEYTENTIIPKSKNFMLDSGAFTFMQGKGGKIDWDDYVNKYANFINKNHIDKYLELDIDNVVGFGEVLKIRDKLEQKTGVKPIPVWHKSRGLERFKLDADNYPYVAIGGIVTKEIKPSEYPVFTVLINEAHKRGAKIHGLGFTNLQGMRKYHFDSVDSTAWVSGNRFGAVYFFDGKTMKKIDKPPGKRVVSNKVALHNFEEWKKFCKYAELHFKKVRQPQEKTLSINKTIYLLILSFQERKNK